MHKIISNNTVFPTKIVLGDYFAFEIIEDYMSLKQNRDRDVLLIVGDATSVLEDIGNWYDIAEGIVDYDTMALNYAATIMPHEIQHYAAGDAHMPDMQAVAASLPDTVTKHAWNQGCKEFDVQWVRNGRGGWNGTSANLALKIGLALDYTRIVLAGCPMDNSGNWYRPLIKETDIKARKDHRHHLWKWMEMSIRPIGRFVRSMSGNTADLFGKPTREWLCHLPESEENESCQKMN
jgi:hypothetical protein